MTLGELLRAHAPHTLQEGGGLRPEERTALTRCVEGPEGSDAPWLLRAMTGAGMWIGALMIGAILFAMDLHKLEGGAIFCGLALLLLASFVCQKRARTLATSQLIWALALGGQMLAFAGLSEMGGASEDTALLLLCMNLLTFALIPLLSLRSASVVASACWAMAYLEALQVSSPGIWVALVVLPLGWLTWILETPVTRRWPSVWPALAYALPISSGLALALLEVRGVGIFVALLWLGVSHLRKSYLLQAIAALQLLGFLFFFYYELSTPLLEKSVWVIGTGMTLLVGAFFLRRRSSDPTPPNPHLVKGLLHALVLITMCWGIVGFSILQKKGILDEGKTILLKLAPVDPRSLMQGDYMRLDYEISREAGEAEDLGNVPRKGNLVVRANAQRVASFVRIGKKQELSKDELLLNYRVRGEPVNRVRLGAEAFFFAEGSGSLYEKAEYGELVVSPDGELVLVGLCDSERKRLGRGLYDAL